MLLMGMDLLETLMCVEDGIGTRIDREPFYDSTSKISQRNPPDASVAELHEMILRQAGTNHADILPQLLSCLSKTAGVPVEDIKMTDFIFRDLGLDG